MLGGIALTHFEENPECAPDGIDGYYYNAARGKRAGMSNNDNMGLSLLLAPEGSGFDALLTVEKQNQKFDPVVSNLTNSTEVFCGCSPSAPMAQI